MTRKKFEFNASISIQNPIGEVWDVVGNFHDLSWCPELVSSCEVVGDLPGTEPGARRIVNGLHHERLRLYSSYIHKIGYAIDDAPSPISPHDVSGFLVELQLQSTGDDSTAVSLRAVWEAEDDRAVAFCNTYFVKMLNEIATAIGQKRAEKQSLQHQDEPPLAA